MATTALATFLPQSQEFNDHLKQIYRPLDASKQQIRVFRIHQSQTTDYDEPVSVELQVVSLNDRDLMYNALSYTWEMTGEHRQILVNGHTYNVTPNQEAALKKFRGFPKLDLLWMDVLSINQLDLAERSQQVVIMGQIYSRSERTQIWLGVQPSEQEVTSVLDWETFLDTDTVRDRESLLRGVPTPDRPRWLDDLKSGSKTLTEAAMAILDAMAFNTRLREMPFFYRDEEGKVQLEKAYYSAIMMVSLLLTTKWFRRVWTIQEAVLSPNPAVVHFGSCSRYLWVLLRAATQFEEDLAQSTEDIVTYVELWTGNSVIPLTEGLIGVAELSNALRLTKEESSQPFGGMLCRLRREATEVRDHVYGLLGFAPEADFEVSYSSSVGDVFARAVLLAENSSDGTGKCLFIDVRGISERPNPHAIPSWVPDLTWSVGFAHRDPEYGFGSHLVEHVGERLDWSRVSYDSTRVSLTIPSVKVDVIKIAPRYPVVLANEGDKHFAKYLVERLDGLFGSHPAVVDRNRLWRTLLHDRPQLDDSRLAILRDIERCTQRVIDGRCTDWQHNMVSNWIDSKTDAFHLVMTCEGRLASVRPSAQAGDEVHIIMGCPLPVVLRPTGADAQSEQSTGSTTVATGSSNRISQYRVIGPGYAEDLMKRDPNRYRFEDLIEVV